MAAAEDTTVYLSWQQLEKELCKVLERYGGTEQLLKKLFPQRRVHQLIFKYETITGRKLSLEEWRKLFKGLDVEQEFLDIVQKFKIGKRPSNIKTCKDREISELRTPVTQQQDREINLLQSQVTQLQADKALAEHQKACQKEHFESLVMAQSQRIQDLETLYNSLLEMVKTREAVSAFDC